MHEVKWLLVGAGEVSRKRVASALAEARGSALVAVCSRDKERAQSLGTTFGASEVFEDFSKALISSSADAVYIATPVWRHAPQAVQALEAGKHVLVEKPLGLNARECSMIVAASEMSRKFTGCAYFRRFQPRYAYTQELIRHNELGTIVSVDMAYSSWFDPLPANPKSWRVVKAMSGGGPLYDMGSHMFDVLIGLFGLPETVYAVCSNLVRRWDVEDSAGVIMKLNTGVIVQSRFNWNSKTWRHTLEIVGSEGRIAWFPFDTGPLTKTFGQHSSQIELSGPMNVHLPLVEDFVQSILMNHSPLSSATEAMKTNILLDAIYQSACSGKEVHVVACN